MRKIFNNVHGVFTRYHVFITMGVVILVVIIIGFGEYQRFKLETRVGSELSVMSTILNENIEDLKTELTNIVVQNNLLNDVVQQEIIKSDSLAEQVGQVTDTATALDKLSKTDPQLLQKYSKVYFLNEHYEPKDLTTLANKYTYDSKIKYRLLDQVVSYLEEMLDEAEDDGVSLKVISAYRSFADQTKLKSNYQIIYGAGTANQFSADQGYSEHQLGTTVDFTTPELKDNFDTFDKTEAFAWLEKNAYKYGFIMSYPKNNTYYVYEPWHWRYVGVDLAHRLNRQKKNFYDLDQRVINNYLGVFFD